jgi:hypothetical protein
MRPIMVCISVIVTACASSSADPTPSPDADANPAIESRCYSVRTRGTLAPDVRLPSLIQLSKDAAPGFVEPGRLEVEEPGADPRLAPISWWVPRGPNAMVLVLGGGYTGYTFDLTSLGQGGWAGRGTYFADFGTEPAPVPLSIHLVPRGCP